MRGARHYVVEHAITLRREHTAYDVLCLSSDGADARHACDGGAQLFRLKLRDGERAVLRRLRLVYCTNDGAPVRARIHLFESAGRGAHPDQTGVAEVVLAGDGEVPKHDTLVYEPNWANLGFDAMPYAGLEDAIAGARSSVAGNSAGLVLFDKNDPFADFVMRHGPRFGLDLQPQVDGEYYAFAQAGVEKVQAWFGEQLMPLFRYTEGAGLRVTWEAAVKPVVAMFRLDYAVIRRGVPTCHTVERALAL
jgi:hypothetical protein